MSYIKLNFISSSEQNCEHTSHEVSYLHHRVVRLVAIRMRQHPISNKSKIISLTPIMGGDGLLRVGGPLSRKSQFSQTHPIIQSNQSVIVDSLLNYNLVVLGHCGPTLLLSSTGTLLHVVGPRHLARAVCRRCTTSRRISEHQMMGQLPAQRVMPYFLFQVTGVDYAGPLTIKRVILEETSSLLQQGSPYRGDQ